MGNSTPFSESSFYESFTKEYRVFESFESFESVAHVHFHIDSKESGEMRMRMSQWKCACV